MTLHRGSHSGLNRAMRLQEWKDLANENPGPFSEAGKPDGEVRRRLGLRPRSRHADYPEPRPALGCRALSRSLHPRKEKTMTKRSPQTRSWAR